MSSMLSIKHRVGEKVLENCNSKERFFQFYPQFYFHSPYSHTSEGAESINENRGNKCSSDSSVVV